MFIPRQSVIENQFCSYGAQTGTGSAGIGGVIAYAGSVLYLSKAAANEEAIVYRYDTYAAYAALESTEQSPFGFCMQKVKTGYHQVHPHGYMMPGDLGSSDVIAQATFNASGAVTGTKATPVGVANLGIWDTVHYTCVHTANVVASGAEMNPGDNLYAGANCEGKVTNSTLTADADDLTYERLNTTVVARVVKGASAAKCSANIANTTLYPIRIKLLI